MLLYGLNADRDAVLLMLCCRVCWTSTTVTFEHCLRQTCRQLKAFRNAPRRQMHFWSACRQRYIHVWTSYSLQNKHSTRIFKKYFFADFFLL